jgi:hypothetical protein
VSPYFEFSFLKPNQNSMRGNHKALQRKKNEPFAEELTLQRCISILEMGEAHLLENSAGLGDLSWNRSNKDVPFLICQLGGLVWFWFGFCGLSMGKLLLLCFGLPYGGHKVV